MTSIFNNDRLPLSNEEISKCRSLELRTNSLYENVYGLDEVNICTYIGNTTYCAISLDYSKSFSSLIRDSKQLTKEQLEKAYWELMDDKIKDIGIGFATVHDYDTLGSRMAQTKGRREAIKNCTKHVDVLFCDYYVGNFMKETFTYKAVRGDEKFLCVSGASIIAKHISNKIMEELDKDFPEYNLKNNHGCFGGSTKNAIIKYGFIPGLCRKSWCSKFYNGTKFCKSVNEMTYIKRVLEREKIYESIRNR